MRLMARCTRVGELRGLRKTVGGGVCKRRRGRRLVAAHRRTSSARRRLMGRRGEVGLLMASRGEDRSVDKCWLIDCSLCSIQCCCIHVKYCMCCLAELQKMTREVSG